ncbi:hypothetical protein GN037_20215 [Escherichia coli]|nr:hypothetical protein [Escherichia coli]
MTSKLAVLTLIPTLLINDANAARWTSEPVVHNNGLMVLRFGVPPVAGNCDGNLQEAGAGAVTKYSTAWVQRPTKYCLKEHMYKPGTISVKGPCGVSGTWNFDGYNGQLRLNGSIWECQKDGFFFDLNNSHVYAYYRPGSGNWINSLSLDRNVLNVTADERGYWQTESLTLTGSNLKQITVTSDRDVTVNLGDEDLALIKNIASQIPPPKQGNGYVSRLKLNFHGYVSADGPTNYNIRLTATFF